ncbi:phage portal protein [Brachybacterium sp. DNPG3]
MTAELDLFTKLDRLRLGRHEDLDHLDAYLRGKQPLKYMAAELSKEFGDRVTQLVINWPKIVTEQYESVINVTGFRAPPAGDGGPNEKIDALMWDIWKENGLDEQSSLLHTESIALGDALMISGAGAGKDDIPVVTVESPFQAYARRDPRTRQISDGIKRWSEGDGDDKVEWGTLYLPNTRITFRKDGSDWVEDARWDHDLGSPLIVPFRNQPRMLEDHGQSEFVDIIPIADAINKMATDMMISGEFHAMPRRYVFGLRKEDFEDEHGNPISDWKKLAGGIWASEVDGKDVQVGQFSEADLTNFHNSIKMLFQIASIVAALPSYVTAFGGDNPASAEALKAAEVTKNNRAERKTTILGAAHAEVQRNNLRILGRYSREHRRIETQFRPVATPSEGQMADYAMKLVSQGIIPPQQARKDLGYSQEQRRQMEHWDRQNLTDPFISRMNREDGIEGV